MKRKKEVFLIIGFAAAALVLFLMFRLLRAPAARVTITVHGEEFGSFPLSEDRVIPINETNTCEIKDGQARMISATCPDKLCMHQSPIDESGGMIVCLPNQVVIEGRGTREAEVDAVG